MRIFPGFTKKSQFVSTSSRSPNNLITFFINKTSNKNPSKIIILNITLAFEANVNSCIMP